LSNNAYGTYPGSVAWVYGNTDSAAQYAMESGTHKWFNAASGTAGNTISFGDPKMTLDASGNLGVGTTSPGARLEAYRSSSGEVARFTASADGVRSLKFISSDNTGSGAVWTRDIDSAFAQHRWAKSGTPLMVLDESGNLLVGTTSANTSSDNRIIVTGSRAIDAKSTGGATAPNSVFWNNATSGDNVFLSFRTETADTQRGSITYNRAGGLTVYNTTSDYRAKDILGPVQNSGATIDALKVYEGQMKGATQSRPMLVAHEAQEHAPYAVTGEKDAVNEDGTPNFQQIDASALVPLLLAEIQSLRARVAQLETK
jgi:hypothetical protein